MADATQPELVDLAPTTTAVVRGRIPMDELTGFYDRAFGEVMSAIQAQGLAVAGAPFGLYHGAPSTHADLEAGFPTDRPVESVGEVVAGSLPGGRVARVMHIGPYDAMVATYERLQSWMVDQGVTPGNDMWECYLTDPSAEPDPGKWQTEIYWTLQ